MSQDYRADRGKGTWRYAFEYHGRRYSGSGYATQREAEVAEKAHRRSLRLGLTDEKPIPPRELITLRDYVEIWMGSHVKVNLRARTARIYRQSLEDHVLPVLGAKGLKQLTRSELREVLAKLTASGLARSTVQNALIPLRACLNSAVDDGLIDVNPAASLGRRMRPTTEREAATVQAYSPTELAALLERAPLEIETLARTGLRLGELLGLEPGDIEPDHLWVRRSVQWVDGAAIVQAPKSGKVRRVDIPRDLAAKLRSLLSSPLFPVRPETIRKAWYAHLDGFWVTRRLRLHDLRHTYAATLLGAGAPVAYVKEQLGHSSIQVTVDVYGHLIPGENRKWVDQTFGTSSPS